MNVWLKEIGPSDDLRNWFSNDLRKWETSEKEYEEELGSKAELAGQVKDAEKTGGTVEIALLCQTQGTQPISCSDHFCRSNA